jgi:hypothetical protein
MIAQRLIMVAVFGVLIFMMYGKTCGAQETAPRQSTMMFGPAGLNTLPNARMDRVGLIRAGIATLDPYAHAFLGVQISQSLYINLRQSAEVSSLKDDADRLYPGIDLKLRLVQEDGLRPAVALGLQSASGHRRLSGEYVALSKRFHDFDFTGGIGWGFYGTGGNFGNPLKTLHGHFGDGRDPRSEKTAGISDWFTGDTIGFFGGVEYSTPVEGLSLKLDGGTATPWSIGLSWQPTPWAELGVAVQNTDKIMARLSLSGLLSDWRRESTQKREADPALYALQGERHSVAARQSLRTGASAPQQIGSASYKIFDESGANIRQAKITPTIMGLSGPSVSLMRRDLQQARHGRGSAQEIWRGALFGAENENLSGARSQNVFYPVSLESQVSLAEDDSGILHRTSIKGGRRAPVFFGILDSGMALRLNLGNNIGPRTTPPANTLPVRSDVERFAERRLGLDESWLAWTHSFRSDLHAVLLGGYLEEMYAGLGGEILYRPFQSRFALGGESWLAMRRNADTPFNLGLRGDRAWTGHLNFYYDLPGDDITLTAQAGRYLGGDNGLRLGLLKHFENGTRLESFVTLSDQSDTDIFGGTVSAGGGLRLSLPLGGYKYMPRDAKIHLRAEPFARDAGQSLESPLPLYELTEPFSYRHLQTRWRDIAQNENKAESE